MSYFDSSCKHGFSLVDKVYHRKPIKRIILDMDRSNGPLLWRRHVEFVISDHLDIVEKLKVPRMFLYSKFLADSCCKLLTRNYSSRMLYIRPSMK